MILIGGEQKNQAIKKDGSCGGYVPLVVFEIRHDEGVRLWNDEVCGALRTIDACGDKYVLVKNE